jgi:peptidoglycan/xylan/chitin deacetylase (PgdA/CDA1 family)
MGFFATAQAEDIDLKEQAFHNQTWGAGRLVKGKNAQGKVAFTFDDGPDLKTTPQILKALEEFNVPATFFVVGRRFANKNSSSQAGAKLLAEIASRGFTIGNHTSRHHRLDKQGFKRGKQSIERNAQDIAEVVGYQSRLFRPPFGAITGKIKRLLRQRGDTLVMWSIDPRDFKRTKDEVLRRRVVAQILRNEGGVIVLHDTKPWTARVLPLVLQDLENANCERLERGERPVLPVSLHYFMRDPDGKPRPIPAEIVNNTQAALERLSDRCKNGD